MNQPNHSRIILAVILLSGALLRLYGINFGLPYLYNRDEPHIADRAYLMVVNNDPNPHWFGHPGSTVIYLLALLYSTISIVGVQLGIFANTSDFELLYFQDPSIFYLSGRFMSALFGVASIPLLYAIGYRLFNRTTGLIAAALFALSPLHVDYSKVIRSDILMTFLLLIAFWFCLDILTKRTWLSYILAGFFCGLAVATKYPAVIVFLVIVAAYILCRSWHDFPKLLTAGISSLAGAFIGSPFMFLDFKTMLGNISFEARSSHLSATGEGPIRNLIWYVQGPLSDSLSMLGLMLGVAGIILYIGSKKKEKWLLLIFLFSFVCFISSLNLRWARWVIPAIPFLCVMIAYAIYWISTWVQRNVNSRSGIAVGSILLLALVGPLVRVDIVRGHEMSAKNTRTLAGEWILEHIPQGSRMLVEKYVPYLPKEWYAFFLVNAKGTLVEINPKMIRRPVFDAGGRIGRLKDIEALHEKSVQYIVLSNWYDRYLAERERSADYAQIVVNYERLMKMGTKIYEIKPVPGTNMGPIIRVYRMNTSFSKRS